MEGPSLIRGLSCGFRGKRELTVVGIVPLEFQDDSAAVLGMKALWQAAIGSIVIVEESDMSK